MIWIIQNSQSYNTGWTSLYEEVIKSGKQAMRLSITDMKKIENKEAPCVIIGGDDFLQAAKALNFNVCENIFGSVDFFNVENYITEFGKSFLNFDSIKLSISDLNEYEGSFFIRPFCDEKCFDGRVYQLPVDVGALKKAKEKCRKSIDNCFCLSSTKNIQKEWRVIVVEGKIISACRYSENGNYVRDRHDVPSSMLSFCSSVIKTNRVPLVFVLDVAFTNGTYKVIECNSFNVSNFYECDYEKIVLAVNDVIEKYYKQGL